MNFSGDTKEIETAIGHEATLRLLGAMPSYTANQRRRGYLSVPKKLTPGHWLIDAIGDEAAQALVDTFGGEMLHPSGDHRYYRNFRDGEIRRRLAEGVKPTTVAFLFDMTLRQIRNISKTSPGNDNHDG